ncbi:MAG: VOC family protein [Paracoccaceae bacterium]|nr:VOC family protein [Paracoccaceae bacterium]
MPHTPPAVSIGHIHLKVSHLDRAVAFYTDVIGLEVMIRYGTSAAFLSSGGYHHHLGLNTWDSRDGTPPPPGHTGLYHVAFLYPDRGALAVAVARALDRGVTLDGASDHGVSEAVYFRDPDDNGIELYRDRPRADWPREADGSLALSRAPLDVAALVAEASA